MEILRARLALKNANLAKDFHSARWRAAHVLQQTSLAENIEGRWPAARLLELLRDGLEPRERGVALREQRVVRARDLVEDTQAGSLDQGKGGPHATSAHATAWRVDPSVMAAQTTGCRTRRVSLGCAQLKAPAKAPAQKQGKDSKSKNKQGAKGVRR